MYRRISTSDKSPVLICAIGFLRWLDPLLLYIAVIGQYYDITLAQIFIMQSICALVLVLAEIPAGMLSDRYGRLPTLILSCLLFVISSTIFWWHPAFVTWMLAESVMALAIACYSGTDTALLFEVCEKNRTYQYAFMESILQTCSRFAEFISAIIGFLCLKLHHSAPILGLLFTKLSMLCATLYLSAKHARIDAIPGHPDKQNDRGLTTLWQALQHRRLKYVIVYAMLISALSITMFWMIQATMLQTQIQSLAMMSIWLAYYALASVASYLSTLFSKPSERRIMALPVLIIAIVAVAYSMPAFKVFAITCSGCLFGLAQPMINMLINENTAPKHRATFHSIYSVGTRLLLVVVLPVTGYLAQNHPIHGVWLWLLSLASLSLVLAIPAAMVHSN